DSKGTQISKNTNPLIDVFFRFIWYVIIINILSKNLLWYDAQVIDQYNWITCCTRIYQSSIGQENIDVFVRCRQFGQCRPGSIISKVAYRYGSRYPAISLIRT